MRQTLILIIVAALLVGGCSGVIMNAEYSQLLDETAALSAETADRAEQGKLSSEEMAQALRLQATAWQKFRDARDGKDGTK